MKLWIPEYSVCSEWLYDTLWRESCRLEMVGFLCLRSVFLSGFPMSG